MAKYYDLAKKIQAIELYKIGQSVLTIGRQLDVSASQVQRWYNLYERYGEEGLTNKNRVVKYEDKCKAVHNVNSNYVTTIEQITFDVTDADSAISVGDIQQVNSLKADTTSLYNYLRSKNLYADYQASQVAASDHAYVDLGLSVMWATCNVGASAPQEYGDYFAWGETETKKNYDWSTYKYMQSGQVDWQYINKYQADDHQFDGVWYKNVKYNNSNGKTTLEAIDDAAAANWGGTWTMPTADDWVELANTDNCTWEWTQVNEKNGYLVTSKANGASIFLPAAGYCDDGDLYDEGSDGYYWSSSLNEDDSYNGRNLYFGSGDFGPWDSNSRYDGQSVRPVCPSAENTNGHVAVDLDLPSGKLWATYNVGASAPEESGDYFAWGETKTKSEYLWSTYADGEFIGDSILTLEAIDDAARANWGGKWRMPTQAEWEELYNNTTQVWNNDYNGTGVSGYVLTSTKEGYEDASIFLPVAGYCRSGNLCSEGLDGLYWSSSLYEYNSSFGRYMFLSGYIFDPWYCDRCHGLSVRPVCPFAE